MTPADREFVEQRIKQDVEHAVYEQLRAITTDLDKLQTSVAANTKFNQMREQVFETQVNKMDQAIHGGNSSVGLLLRLCLAEQSLTTLKEGSSGKKGLIRDVFVQSVTMFISLALAGIGWLLYFIFKVKGTGP